MVFACQKGSALCTWATPTQSLISREYRRNTVIGIGRAKYRLEYLPGQN